VPNITQIPAPRVDFIDPRTGLMAREWYRFFLNLYTLTGGGTTDTSIADLQIAPVSVVVDLTSALQDAASGPASTATDLTSALQDASLAPATMPTIPTVPAGSTNYVQYNSAGLFAASIKYQWDDAANTMTFATGASSVTSYIKAAPTTTGDGNTLRMVASDGSTDNNGSGGSITFAAGNGFGDGSGTGTSNGGGFSFVAGSVDSSGFSDDGNGGPISFTGGAGQGNTNGKGGSISFFGGLGNAIVNGDGGSINFFSGGSASHASGNMLFQTNSTYLTQPGRIDFNIGVTLALRIGVNRNINIGTPTSGISLTVGASGAAGTAALQIAGTSAGQPALRVDTSATTGGTTPTWTAPTNKPGAAAGTVTHWLPINIAGTTRYIPCWS